MSNPYSSMMWEASEFEAAAFGTEVAEYMDDVDEYGWQCPGCGIHCGCSPNVAQGMYVYICGSCGEKFNVDIK